MFLATNIALDHHEGTPLIVLQGLSMLLTTAPKLSIAPNRTAHRFGPVSFHVLQNEIFVGQGAHLTLRQPTLNLSLLQHLLHDPVNILKLSSLAERTLFILHLLDASLAKQMLFAVGA